jgi:hypothetical protein
MASAVAMTALAASWMMSPCNLLEGADRLTAAPTLPCLSKSGAPTQHAPISFSPSSSE